MSKIPHSSNKSIHDALRVLAREIESEDGAANVAIAEAADRISELGTESEQLRRENAALKKQLTDTTDQFFSVSSENAALRAELAPLRETVGVAATASTCADDLSNWSKLVERADNSTRLERENAALREDIQTLCGIIDHANPNAWENGNTHPDGYGPDEGTVMMEQLYGPLWHKYVQPAIAARKEVQP